MVELLDALLLAAARNARAPTVPERAGRRASGAKPVGTPGKGSRHAPEEDAAPGEEPAEPPAQDTAGADVWLEQPGSTHSVPGVRHSAGRVDALPDAQGIGRALRPLRYRRPSATRRHLDVDATVDHFTQTGLLVPQLAATPESWLEAVVVLDGGTAMTVWTPRYAVRSVSCGSSGPSVTYVCGTWNIRRAARPGSWTTVAGSSIQRSATVCSASPRTGSCS
ncbi:hypothetical protein [Streptomyces mirabilis]